MPTKQEKLSKRDREIMDVIIRYIEEHQYPPSIREIRDLAGLQSVSSVYLHLQKLYRQGLIETDAEQGASRAFRISGYHFSPKKQASD